MGLHRSSKKADWQKVPPGRRTLWQRLARASKGIVTPGNAVSLLGLVLVLTAAYLLVQERFAMGLLALAIGRVADLFDGVVAERTRTKSPLGEALDATADKLAVLVMIPAVVIEHLLPLVVLGIIVLQNGVNVIVAAIARRRHITLRPTVEGKISTAAAWACVIAFSALAAAKSGLHPAVHGLLYFAAYASLILFVVYGFRASRNYTRLVFDSSLTDEKLERVAPDTNLLRQLHKIVFVVNTQSSNVQRFEKRNRELSELFPDKPVKLTKITPPAAQLRTSLQSELHGANRPTLIAIGGGDGTVNRIVNELMSLHHENNLDLDLAPILPLWGGNANDLATMLNGSPSRTTVKKLLMSGRRTAIYPLKIITKRPGQASTTRYAACYASFGASAYAAAELEKPNRKDDIRSNSAFKVLIKELQHVGRALTEAPGFEAEQDGLPLKIYEQAFANGSRMAKLERFPVKLQEKQFYHLIKSDRHPTVLFYVRQLLQGKKLGEVTNKTFQFTLREPAWAQFDGEAILLPENTTVTVGHADIPFYAIMTRRRG